MRAFGGLGLPNYTDPLVVRSRSLVRLRRWLVAFARGRFAPPGVTKSSRSFPISRAAPKVPFRTSPLMRPRSPILCFAQTSSGSQVIDLSALVWPQSRLDDHPATPAAPAPPLLLRRAPPARPREPRPSPAACRLQANPAPPEASHDGSSGVGRPGQSLGRLEAGSGHRV